MVLYTLGDSCLFLIGTPEGRLFSDKTPPLNRKLKMELLKALWIFIVVFVLGSCVGITLLFIIGQMVG